MKRVKLIKFKDEDIMVGDMMDLYEQHFMSCNSPNRIIDSYGEYVPEFCSKETLPIRRVVDHGVEHYIAVSEKIWEYLYCIENPVTAKTQEAKIQKLSEESESWHREAECISRSFKRFKSNVFGTSLLTRIKWVFTGVKL
ncbi:MAG: hypothetical protein QQN63_10050 [Nitrosopumilus sp.]